MIFPIFSYTFQIEAETCVSASKSFMRFFMSNSIGLYIHIPFCKHKCPYCDFFSGNADENAFDDYVIELKDKIKTEEAIENQENTIKQEEQIQEDMEELIQALQVLGYRRYEINNILPKIKEETLEDRIKEALQYLSR